ncbi:dihydroorotate dehydrogenase-like protein [Alkaliphilus crotonatoxidans]
MKDLSTQYMGIQLRNPIVAGASSLTGDMEALKAIEQAGAGAVVIKSLFQEEVQLESIDFDHSLNRYNDLHAEMLTHYPHLEHGGAREHLFWVKRAKESLKIPVIASINAVDADAWIEYAKALEETGVDGLELNFYSLPRASDLSASEIEQHQLAVLKGVKAAVKIPVSVKLSPYYTNLTAFTRALEAAGADGIILFNRLFQPDIDLVREEEKATFEFSDSYDNRLTLRWTALLSDELKADIISNTGIITTDDVIKMLLAGAAAVQVVSTLYKNKIDYLFTMLKELEDWMEEKQYNSLKDFSGKLSKKNLKDPWAYERVHYIKMLLSKKDIKLT